MNAPYCVCDKCGNLLNGGELGPCPTRGNHLRKYVIKIHVKTRVVPFLVRKWGFRGKGKRTWIFRAEEGLQLYRKSGKVNAVTRTYERENDKYMEKIIDPETGAIIKFCEEPLSQHRGHGSSKKTKGLTDSQHDPVAKPGL